MPSCQLHPSYSVFRDIFKWIAANAMEKLNFLTKLHSYILEKQKKYFNIQRQFFLFFD